MGDGADGPIMLPDASISPLTMPRSSNSSLHGPSLYITVRHSCDISFSGRFPIPVFVPSVGGRNTLQQNIHVLYAEGDDYWTETPDRNSLIDACIAC